MTALHAGDLTARTLGSRKERRSTPDLFALGDLDPLAPLDEPVPTEVAGQRSCRRAGGGILVYADRRREHARLPGDRGACEAVGLDAERCERAEVRPHSCDRGGRLERNERVRDSVVVALYRQRGSSHTESGQELPGLGIRLESRHRLSHPPEGQRSGLVSIHLDGDHAHPGLELDQGTLERLTQHPGRSENGVPCERQLDERREDAYLCRPTLLCRKNERRLREADLQRERLHGHRVEFAGIREDGQLVSG